MPEKLFVSVDSQELNGADFCPERWNLEFVEHWKSRRKPKYFDRGAVMHAMLAHYYRQRTDYYDKDGAFHKARLEPVQQNDIIKECETLGRSMIVISELTLEEFEKEDLRVFKDYILRWQYDGWEILSIELPFSVVLYDSEKLRIDYTGITDLIVKDPKLGKMVVDTKTEGRKSTPFLLSNQFQGYEFASGLPMCINKIGFQQESTPIEERFRRIIQQSAPEVLAEWRSDAIRTVIDTLGWMQDLQKGRRLKKNRTSCDKYSGCIFQKVCKEQPDVREHILMTNFMKKKWDPFTRDDEEKTQEVA